MTAYLELADYLLIAERVLGLPAEAIANCNRIGARSRSVTPPPIGSATSAARALAEP